MKKKIVSMLLALALVVTGMPFEMTMDTAYAAEVVQEQESTVLSDEFQETDEMVEHNDMSEEVRHLESGDLFAFNVSENGKAVGADGIVYDDVAYLSANVVNALNTDAQNAYFAFCDEIAAARSAGIDLNDAVVAVDENGTLVFQYAIPVEALTAAMDELSEERMETAGEQKETEIALQEEETVDTQLTEETIKETDAAIEETTVDADLKEENTTEEVSSEERTESVAEESSVEETTTEELSTEEALPTESIAEESSVEETTTEIETEAVEDSYIFSAENMELITVTEAEEFPVLGNVKAELIVDLGYDGSDIQQANSILPSADFFSSQLSSNQKAVYNGCKGMLKGTNKFKFKASSKLTYEDFCQAISAHILTNAYHCDWMDLSSTGELKIEAWYYSKSDPTYDFEVTIGKSDYYNAALVTESNAKVLEIASQAQKYALENYPQSPVYGIVKYFDKWICENNYYNNIGVTGGSSADGKTREIYYYCHSSYGILLKGYGVCESYALAMMRLLDTIGIPNMYVTGQALDENGNLIVDKDGNLAGGHAWNYIQMPNGNWYLQDSTWNDDEETGASLEYFLLSKDDGRHLPIGNRYKAFTDIFDFVTLDSASYKPVSEIALSKEELNLIPKDKIKLECVNAYTSDKNVPKTWMSSNEKVVKVDNDGNVTAVAPGTAEVKYIVAGITAVCTVNVHQINSLVFADGGKTSFAASCGAKDGKWEKQEIELVISHKDENCAYTVEKLVKDEVFSKPTVVSSKPAVAEVKEEDIVLDGDKLKLAITPKSKGSTKLTITFEGKKATLNFSVMGEQLDESMFDLKAVNDLQGKKNPYTGKAYKPKVVLSTVGKEKKVKFKVNYYNNIDAGKASVIIVGAGNYGGQIVRTFEIEKMPLSVVDPEKIKIKNSVYNGGVNQMKCSIKNLNQYKDDKGKDVKKKAGLKVGKDYDILYTNTTTKIETTQPTEAGTYTMKIVGKNSYTGEQPISGEYKITAIDVKKVKVSIKVNGTTPTVTVAIGKNQLSKSDYKLTYYTDKNCENETSGTVFLPKTQYYVRIESASTNLDKTNTVVKSFKTK